MIEDREIRNLKELRDGEVVFDGNKNYCVVSRKEPFDKDKRIEEIEVIYPNGNIKSKTLVYKHYEKGEEVTAQKAIDDFKARQKVMEKERQFWAEKSSEEFQSME